MFILRPYQKEAVKEAVSFLSGPAKHNAIEVLPTGSGKSLVVAATFDELREPLLVLQPSREILDQNRAKLGAYGHHAAVYSASKGRTEVANITLATIGSVIGKTDLFTNFRHIIVDECHLVNPEEGMYKTFLGALTEAGAKVLGLTATPYRLIANRQGSELHFLTQMKPRIFQEMICHVQNRSLFDAGYLARLVYVKGGEFDRSQLRVNSTGADYTDESVHTCLWASNLPVRLPETVRAVMAVRKNILVFTRFVEEAQYLSDSLSGVEIVTGETPKKERQRIIDGFKGGDIRAVCNVGVLTTGFDYPELETIIIARPTMSLALYYQMIGRASRPHPKKNSAMIIDMCGNYEMFGPVEDLEICRAEDGAWFMASNGRQLTV